MSRRMLVAVALFSLAFSGSAFAGGKCGGTRGQSCQGQVWQSCKATKTTQGCQGALRPVVSQSVPMPSQGVVYANQGPVIQHCGSNGCVRQVTQGFSPVFGSWK